MPIISQINNITAYILSIHLSQCLLVLFQKISIFPLQKAFCFAPPVPTGIATLASYFASKILTFKTPLPLGIFDDLPWGGYGFDLAPLQPRSNCPYLYNLNS